MSGGKIMQTDDMIRHLAAQAPAVRRLPAPPSRLMRWLAWSVPWVVVVVLLMGVRPDLAAKLHDLRWLAEQGAALTTAVMAAMAAFCAGVPGRPRWEHAMPLLPLSLWLGLLVVDAGTTVAEGGLTALNLRPDWMCFPGILVVGAVPGVVMAVMLRRSATVAPVTAAALGALASAGLAAFGLRLFHVEDASGMVLVWQVGTVMVLTLAGGIGGPRLLRWPITRL